ncbi:MAG: NAD(P)-dependent alcohol dehydrogenase [Betaproteobacteria bacterium]
MSLVQARGVRSAQSDFEPMSIARREPGPRDVVIDIAYAGICHSDIEHARSLRGRSMYPLVPGHEMAGLVRAVGTEVRRFAIGDRVGVGNMVDSCRLCARCQAGLEQYCSGRRVLTYNSLDHDGQPTYGGYSQQIVVDEHFVLRIPDAIPLKNAAPLLCAGITLYSPLRHWQAGPSTRVAIVGLGGLGHVGVRMAKAMGCSVTVLELHESKRADALRLGADAFFLSEPAPLKAWAGRFDLLISTVPATLDFESHLGLLDLDGTMVTLALPAEPLTVPAAALLMNRRRLAGTRSGGLRETQEMLDFCAHHGIGAEVEVIHADGITDAYRRLEAGDVRFRFVIDNSTLAKA